MVIRCCEKRGTRCKSILSTSGKADQLLIQRIRSGDSDAWNDLIARFEGRLLAFVESRIGHRASAEDVVQETFIGFLTSLPNFDERRSLESWLFSISAHKLTDYLRKKGRRPALPLSFGSSGDSDSQWEPSSGARAASSIMRSGERRGIEEAALAEAIQNIVDRWRKRGDILKIMVVELLFVRGWSNKDVAKRLDTSEQTVANYKFEFLAKIRAALRDMQLSEDVFPELYETEA